MQESPPCRILNICSRTAWQAQATPNPAHGIYSILDGVSCVSAVYCTAAGYHGTGPHTSTALAMAWNGKSWAMQYAPGLPGAVATFLYSVSCTSPAACVAVGGGTAAYELTMAGVWNGKTWTAHFAASPTLGDVLYGVSCTGSAACTAVGTYTNGGIAPLAETWHGTTWTLQRPSPRPARH